MKGREDRDGMAMRWPGVRQLPGDCPITWIVLGTNALTFLISFVGGGAVWSPLVFRTFTFPAQPWTALTFPLVAEGNILWLLIGGYVFWLFGGSLERSWGRRDYLVFLGLTAAFTAISLWLGSVLLGRGAVLAGLWMPLAAAVIAWTAINPSERMLLYFVIPVQSRWLGAATVILVMFSFPFPLGVFALAGPAVAWWFVRGGRFLLTGRVRRPAPHRRTAREADSLTMNPFRVVRRWRQRRRFRRMMRNAGLDDRDG